MRASSARLWPLGPLGGSGRLRRGEQGVFSGRTAVPSGADGPGWRSGLDGGAARWPRRSWPVKNDLHSFWGNRSGLGAEELSCFEAPLRINDQAVSSIKQIL